MPRNRKDIKGNIISLLYFSMVYGLSRARCSASLFRPRGSVVRPLTLTYDRSPVQRTPITYKSTATTDAAQAQVWTAGITACWVTTAILSLGALSGRDENVDTLFIDKTLITYQDMCERKKRNVSKTWLRRDTYDVHSNHHMLLLQQRTTYTSPTWHTQSARY